MKPLRVADASNIVLGLQGEIRRSEESRYDHRLHAVLLVAQGMICPEVASLLGDAERSVEYWVHRFEDRGLAGLAEGDWPGRPARLSAEHLEQIGAVLRRTPREEGLSGTLWDGKTLSAFIERRYGIDLGERQSQRLLRRLRFRRRKPWLKIAQADPAREEAHEKDSKR